MIFRKEVMVLHFSSGFISIGSSSGCDEEDKAPSAVAVVATNQLEDHTVGHGCAYSIELWLVERIKSI